MKKKLKIVGIVIGVLVLVYVSLFNTKSTLKEYALAIEEEYGEYIAFAVDKPTFSWLPEIGSGSILSGTFMSGGYIEGEERILVMFRWDAYALKQKMKKELMEELEGLKRYQCFEYYTYDEERFSLEIKLNYEEAKDGNEYSECFNYAHDVIGYKFYDIGMLYGRSALEVEFSAF